MYPERIAIFKKLLLKKMLQLKQILGQKEITKSITNYELGITDYELAITDYELRIKQIFHLPLPNDGWPFRQVLHCG
jgi:hypothetical protein